MSTKSQASDGPHDDKCRLLRWVSHSIPTVVAIAIEAGGVARNLGRRRVDVLPSSKLIVLFLISR